jgi:hypothetical protein
MTGTRTKPRSTFTRMPSDSRRPRSAPPYTSTAASLPKYVGAIDKQTYATNELISAISPAPRRLIAGQRRPR